MVSTSLSLQNSYNYPIHNEQTLSRKPDKQLIPYNKEQQKFDFLKPIHSVWSFFKPNPQVSAEPIVQEQQKVIKSKEDILSIFYSFEFQTYWIESLYSIQENEKIQVFLEINRFLVPFLLTAFAKIKKYFPDSIIRLDLDHEDESDLRLVATILTSKSPDEAFQQLQQLDDQWWLEALDDAQMKISISLEFK